MTIPTTEPSMILKGDTVKWTKSFADYAATIWTLKYALRGVSSIDITAAASGSDFLVTLTAAATAAYVIGGYSWSAYVEQGVERYTVGSGSVSVKENPTAAALVGVETRSESKVILDNLMAAHKTYTASQGVIQRYMIGSREMWFKDSASLIKDIQYWRLQVQNEQHAARLEAGLGGNTNRILTRYTTNI